MIAVLIWFSNLLTRSNRKLRETVRSFLDEPHLMTYINIFKDGLWPGGILKPPSVPRTVEEKLHTRDEANRKLSALMPGAPSRTRIVALSAQTTSRPCCKHDRAVQRASWGSPYIRRATESPLEPALGIHYCGRGGCSVRPPCFRNIHRVYAGICCVVF